MLIYLEPLSLFPELHSDTIFGALTYAIKELYGEEKVKEMLIDFEEEPPFILSSTFPYLFKDDIKIRFFPKVILNLADGIEKSINDLKEYKKVDFLEEEIFFKLVNGEITEGEIISNISNYHKVKNLLMKEDYEIDIGFSENIIPNNSINRLNSETKIFYTSGKEFKNLGLFFIIEFNDENYKPIVKSAIKFLKDRGFGKDISVGKGHFDFTIDEDYSINDFLKNQDDMDYFITLSRYIPSCDEIEEINESSSYEIGSKRGMSSSGEIRNQVRFFKEGSIFPIYKDYYGTIVSSGSDSNPAVEFGFAFPLKCIGNGDNL